MSDFFDTTQTSPANDTGNAPDLDIAMDEANADSEEQLSDAEYEDLIGKENTDEEGMATLVESPEHDPNDDLPKDADFYYVKDKNGRWKKVKKKKAVKKAATRTRSFETWEDAEKEKENGDDQSSQYREESPSPAVSETFENPFAEFLPDEHREEVPHDNAESSTLEDPQNIYTKEKMQEYYRVRSHTDTDTRAYSERSELRLDEGKDRSTQSRDQSTHLEDSSDSIVRQADVVLHEGKEQDFPNREADGMPDVLTIPEGVSFGQTPEMRAKAKEESFQEKREAVQKELSKEHASDTYQPGQTDSSNPYGFSSESSFDYEKTLLMGNRKNGHDTEAFAAVKRLAEELSFEEEKTLQHLEEAKSDAKTALDAAKSSMQMATKEESDAYNSLLSERASFEKVQRTYQDAIKQHRLAGSPTQDAAFEQASAAYAEGNKRVQSAIQKHEEAKTVVARMRDDLLKKEGDFGQALENYKSAASETIFTRRQTDYLHKEKGFVLNQQNGSSERIVREVMRHSENEEIRTLADKKKLTSEDWKRLEMLTGNSDTVSSLSREDQMLVRAFRECTAKKQKSADMVRNGILGAGQVGDSLVFGQIRQQFRQVIRSESETTDEEQARKDLQSIVHSVNALDTKLGVSGLFGASSYYNNKNYQIGYAASFVDKHLGSTDRLVFGDGFTRKDLIAALSATDEQGHPISLTRKQRKAIRLYGSVGGSIADSRNILMAMMNPNLKDDVLGVYKKDARGNFVLDKDGKKIFTRRGKEMAQYVRNPKRFLYNTSPKLSTLMYQKALYASKNPLVRKMATLDFRHRPGVSFQSLDKFIEQAEKIGVTNHDIQLLKGYRQAQNRVLVSRARFAKAGQLGAILTQLTIRSNEDAAETLRQMQQTAAMANTSVALARAGIHFVTGAGNVVWSSRFSRFVRRKMGNTTAGKAIARAKTAVSTAASVQTAAIQQAAAKKAAEVNASVIHHVTNNAIVKEGVKHAKSTLGIVSSSKAGKAASAVGRGAKKTGNALREVHRATHAAASKVTDVLFAPFRAIQGFFQKAFDLGRKVKLIVGLILLLFIGLAFLLFMLTTASTGVLIGGGTATQTQTSIQDQSFVKELIQKMNEKDKEKLRKAQKIGQSKPKNATAAGDKELNWYGWGCALVNGRLKKGGSENQYKLTDDGNFITKTPNYNTGYYIRYVTKEGFDNIDNVDGDYSKLESMDPGSSNAKQILAVATTMFENIDMEKHQSEYLDLVNDLYEYMAPFDPDDEAYYRESHLMTNDDEPDKSNVYVEGAADDEFTYYCNDIHADDQYEKVKHIVDTGGAVYNEGGKTSLQEPTDEGCEEVLDEDGNPTGEYYCPGHTYRVCYGHKVLNIFIPLWSVDDVVYVKDEGGSYAAEHPEEAEFQNPDTKPQKGTAEYTEFMKTHDADEYEAYGTHYGYRPADAKDALPDDYQNRSYYPYIKAFLEENGGWSSQAFRQMVQNLSQQSWYEDLYYGGDPNATDDRSKSLFSVRGTFDDDEIEQILEDNGYEDVGDLREALVSDALGMVGRIPYFFGGGQYLVSPNLEENGFGAQASRSDPYYSYNLAHGRTAKGLDCSSFIRFELWRILGEKGKSMIHTTADCPGTEFYNHSQLKPGDLGMEYPRGSLSQGTSNHIGIYVGRKNGKDLWVHCAGSTGVVCNNFNGFSVYYRIFD